GVLHSRCSVRNETSDWRAAGFVAGARPTGMLTRPKLMEPFQIVRMGAVKILVGRHRVPRHAAVPFPSKLVAVTQVEEPLARQDPARPGEARHIARLWRDSLAKNRPFPAYLVEDETGWREVSWREAGRPVDEIANGLLTLGIGKGDAVAIVGRTRIEWALIDFALGLVGAIGAAVYPTSSAADCTYIVGPSEAVACFVEDDGQRAKVEDGREALPRLREIISFAELDD